MFHQIMVFCLGSWCALQGSNFKQNLPKLCPSCHGRWLLACFDPSISQLLSAVETCLPFAVLHNSSGTRVLSSGHPGLHLSSLSSFYFVPVVFPIHLQRPPFPFCAQDFSVHLLPALLSSLLLGQVWIPVFYTKPLV